MAIMDKALKSMLHDPQNRGIKEKPDKLNHIKNFCTSEDTLNSIKRQPKEGEKY